MSAKFFIWVSAIFLAGFLLLGGSYWVYQKVKDLDAIEKTIAQDFPEVEHISTGTLATLLAAEKDKVLLIDCRNPEEFAVSRIPGAVNLQEVDEVLTVVESREETPAKIAVYCSVGYRSAKLAQALEREGVQNVVNVRGSIFAWANEDRPLEKPNGEPAKTVHPYDQIWARLLNEEKRASIETNDDD